jgi:hypothetical protein
MLVTTKLLCSAAAAAIAACTYVNLPTFDAKPAQGQASFTAEAGGRSVDAVASPQFPDAASLPACPWNPCDIGAMFSMGAR